LYIFSCVGMELKNIFILTQPACYSAL